MNAIATPNRPARFHCRTPQLHRASYIVQRSPEFPSTGDIQWRSEPIPLSFALQLADKWEAELHHGAKRWDVRVWPSCTCEGCDR